MLVVVLHIMSKRQSREAVRFEGTSYEGIHSVRHWPLDRDINAYRQTVVPVDRQTDRQTLTWYRGDKGTSCPPGPHSGYT